MSQTFKLSPTIKNVVLADDDEDDVLVFRDAVQKACAALELQVVADGDQLMKLLQVIKVPDLILIDLNMPGTSGKECLQMIRADQRFNSTKLMIFSISSTHKDIQYCLNNGADYYTVKFGSLRQLAELVDDICRGELKNRFTIGS
ncbi:response regulator [Segetibacter sp. 3557_3]|uniref:response regulator n=1 Tax=Segetibacter sp. 3557_3 TaxID=2547429 RepID=UPI0014043923|nr:response regulator [Segetibacter sp. 3557_3]